MVLGGNHYDRSELAGAFGDLGTLVPFVVGYVTINRLDPQAVLLGFGLFALVTGLYFRTPMPVQPMKAIATVAVTQAGTVTPAIIWASGLVTGVFWLAMAITGAASWVAALTRRPVVRGLMLGLGLSFILEGVNLMQRAPALAIAGAASRRSRQQKSVEPSRRHWIPTWRWSRAAWRHWREQASQRYRPQPEQRIRTAASTSRVGSPQQSQRAKAPSPRRRIVSRVLIVSAPL